MEAVLMKSKAAANSHLSMQIGRKVFIFINLRTQNGRREETWLLWLFATCAMISRVDIP
jgi:hypothetical protein